MRKYVLLFLGCLAFHVAGTWSLPLIDRDEPRFAEASREMLERGDYIVPYFNNQFRFDKPPLTYWCQVASFRVFGENDFAARLPTAIAAALVAVLLLEWGKRIRDERAGWWAAIVFTLALQTFVHSKAAVADMWLVLFFTLAHRSGWELLFQNRKRRIFWWIFYISLAFGFLAKGPIAWTPLLTVALAKLFHPEKRLNAQFRFVSGLTLMLAIVCVWAVPALMRTQGDFFRVGIMHHIVGRSFSVMEGHGASSPLMYLVLLPFYFVTIFGSFFPWSIKLPALWTQLRSNRDGSDTFLITGTLIIFGIFTLVKTKLPHYTLPAFPLLALLLARRFDSLRLSRKLVISTAIVYVAVTLLVTPALRRFFPSYTLARESRGDLKPEMEFGAVDYNEPSLVWYFRDRIRGFMTTLRGKDAANYMAKPGARFVVLPSETAAVLFPNPERSWQRHRVTGFNIAKGQRVDLTLLLKPQ
jgi:4-amino-4-deoxy-L-arabinose transferase-like glycosyltransferase